MNGREEYITIEITQSRGTPKKKREAQRKEGGSCVTERSWGFSSSNEGNPDYQIVLPRTTLSLAG